MLNKPNDYELQSARMDVERYENWRKASENIPPIHFKSEWAVKIMPPWGGAMARFYITYKDKAVSVYLDTFSRLGWMPNRMDAEGEPIPYYELYPYENDVKRYTLDKVAELEKDIEAILEGE